MMADPQDAPNNARSARPARAKLTEEELKLRAKESARRYYLRKKSEPGWLEQKLAANAARDAENPDRAKGRQRNWAEANKDKVREKGRRWTAANKAKVAAKRRRQRQKDVARANELARKWARANPDKIREYTKRRWPKFVEYQKKRYATDPVFKIRGLIARRILKCLKAKNSRKTSSVLAIIDCSIDELKRHIENQFLPGMTWANHGKWHIDHIRPLASFDLTDWTQLRRAFSRDNMQPLWALDNQRKHARLDWKPETDR